MTDFDVFLLFLLGAAIGAFIVYAIGYKQGVNDTISAMRRQPWHVVRR